MLKVLTRVFFDPALQKKKGFLRSLLLFKDLKDQELGVLAHALHSRTYHMGETLFMEGDIGRALFILESGKVDLSRRDGSGKERRIYPVEPGGFFGEMALLEQLPRTASAIAAERSHVYLLYRSKLDALLHDHPRIGASIMRHLAELLSARLRQSDAAVSGSLERA
ncbi:MAG: cyclic nucleotide-binding domain-containing protein [Elusimicrobia bacterium]|nr:cyclic nucleotide-binding domain-containing protein [Elusimicrobiota bacterium]